jgi:citrate lyase subunit beta/citryl-CoA lyase
MTSLLKPRSLLYVPAHAEKFVCKAHERGADAVILDLEDSVPGPEKERARMALRSAVPAVGRNGSTVFVRINSLLSEGWLADAQASIAAGAFGLLVPKVRDAADLVQLDGVLGELESSCGRDAPIRIVPMIEAAGAVLNARSIAAATHRNYGLLTGSEDLATSMGAQPIPELLRVPKLLVHLAAKAEGLLSFGLLRSIAHFRELDEISRAASEAKSLGFDGATCVHPTAVDILNQAFKVDIDVDRARRMIAAYEAALADGKGAVVFEGEMIDLPVVTRARKMIESA